MNRRKTYLLTALLAATPPALAANSGAPDAQLLLGPIPTYTSEPAAQAACPRDSIVWADRYSGTYYGHNEPQFAKTQDGAFACRHEAERANYWDTSPLSSMEKQPGRTFPYQPLYLGS